MIKLLFNNNQKSAKFQKNIIVLFLFLTISNSQVLADDLSQNTNSNLNQKSVQSEEKIKKLIDDHVKNSIIIRDTINAEVENHFQWLTKLFTALIAVTGLIPIVTVLYLFILRKAVANQIIEDIKKEDIEELKEKTVSLIEQQSKEKLEEFNQSLSKLNIKGEEYLQNIKKNEQESSYLREEISETLKKVKEERTKKLEEISKSTPTSFQKSLNLPGHQRLQQLIGELNLKSFEDVNDLSPNELKIIGNAYYFEGSFESAITCYKKALEYNPDDYEIIQNIANSLASLDQDIEAIDEYKKVLKINPEYHWGWHSLADSLVKRENYKEAITDYKVALALKENNSETFLQLGNVYRHTGQNKEAMDCYNKARDLGCNNASLWYGRASVISELKGEKKKIDENYDKAEIILKESLEKKPDNPTAYYHYAKYYSLKHNPEKALENLEKAVSFEFARCKQWAKRDQDFKSIRNMDRFKELIDNNV